MPTNYITNDTDLTIVANAIRTKGGTQAQLTYPNGFATAIQNLPSYTTYDNSYVSLYTITQTLTNVTASASNESYIEANGTVTLTYTANSGYTLPASVSVTGATGTWTQASGTLVLSNPTGNVTFSIEGVVVPSGETWVLNQNLVITNDVTFNIAFISNGYTLNSIRLYPYEEDDEGDLYYYGDNFNYNDVAYTTNGTDWNWGHGQVYRTITFETAPTGDLLTWLQANAVKQ